MIVGRIVADLKRVAQKWLQPDKMIIIVAATSKNAKEAPITCCRTSRRSRPWPPSSAAGPSKDWPRNTATARSIS